MAVPWSTLRREGTCWELFCFALGDILGSFISASTPEQTACSPWKGWRHCICSTQASALTLLAAQQKPRSKGRISLECPTGNWNRKLQKGISCGVLVHKVNKVSPCSLQKSAVFNTLFSVFFLKHALHLHGAAWCCCVSSSLFARRAAKAARYAGALYWAHGRNFFGEATVRERHVILVGRNNLNCETMQTLNNNVDTYYIYMHIYLHIILSPTWSIHVYIYI